MLEKKRISEIAARKIAPLRLVKCYVCNQLFNTQPEFNAHLQQHQSKLNRTNVEQLQRKTQQSFRKKRLPSAIERPTNEKQPKQEKMQQNKSESVQKEDENIEQQQKQIEEALRESQVLLEKIEFITQIGQEDTPTNQGSMYLQQDSEEQFPTLGEYELYQKISNIKSPNEIQNVILATNFEEQFFANYQQQIRHLKKLGKIAIKPQTQIKLANTRKKIYEDVIRDLQNKYRSAVKSEYLFQQNSEKVYSEDNVGELSYCSVCFMTIQAGSEFLKSSNGSSYHTDCYKDFQ